MRKNHLMRTSFPLRSLLSISFLLSAAACGSCKDDGKDKNNENEKDEKTPLKFSLTPPAEKLGSKMKNSTNKQLHVGDLVVKVTEGKDNAANYKVRISNLEFFKYDDYDPVYLDGVVDSKALLEAPSDDTSLKTIFGEDVLEKDKNKSVPVTFKSQAKACTSRSAKVKISIVDKGGKVVGGPVEVKWTDF